MRRVLNSAAVVCGALLCMPCNAHGQTFSFTTLRESGGAIAQFDYPNGVALDRAGNLYVAEGTFADDSRHRIRKITAAGVVTTLAGSGVPGFADGTGASAQFNTPMGLAVDDAGNVYVADGANYRIRKISPNGVVTTLAGSGTWAYAEGAGIAAQFSFLYGLAVDSAGNVYVGDRANRRVRKITPAGMVTTLAGSGVRGSIDGPAAVAQFAYPAGVAVDTQGNVYVTENGSEGEAGNRVRKITPAGMVSTLAGSDERGFVDGIGAGARFNEPWGLAIDGTGNLYVADSNNRRIRKITPTGVVTTLAGSGRSGFADGNGADAQFWYPTGVVVDAVGERLYVADWSSDRIRKGQPAPFVVQAPERFVFPGGTLRLEVSVPRPADAYQWFRDGAALSGQTQTSLLVSNATAADAGNYTVRVTNSFDTSVTSPMAVRVSPDASRLINMSSRTNIASGQIIIPSFFVQGSGRKDVLIRAVGPGLEAYGVSGFLADPQLTLYSGSTPISSNNDWDAAALEGAFTRVGAFSLRAGSKDAALLASLPAGQAYTVQVGGLGGSSGVVLIEVYDADGPRATSKLTNVSVRGGAGSAANTLIVGFVVQGLGQRPLLIRGAGPALAAFDVQGRLADPQLSVYNEYNLMVARNDEWENNEAVNAVRSATTMVGAFPFAAGSRDTATLVLLHTGAYTVQITSASNRFGEVLAEVYEAP